jgi:SanA protein
MLLPLLVLAVVIAVTYALNRTVQQAGAGVTYRNPADVPDFSVAIVPGAHVRPDGSPSLALQDRLHAALDLFRAGKVQRILVSGDHHGPKYDEPNAMRRWLLAQGVPSESIFMDHAGLRTLDTMQRAARVFLVRRAVVCTQTFHLPRSLYLAQQAGIQAVGLAADRRVYAKRTFDAVRETGARVKAWLDVKILNTQARFLGPTIPIDGDATQTHDVWTQRNDSQAQTEEQEPMRVDSDE